MARLVMKLVGRVAIFLALFPILGYSATGRANEVSEAKEHYKKGTTAFELGAYDEAVAEYAAAYRLRNDPAILYNLAQANRLGGHPLDAVRQYRMFLIKVPNAPNRPEVEQRIADLQQQIAMQPKPQPNAAPENFQRETAPSTPLPNRAEPNRSPSAPVTPPVVAKPTAATPTSIARIDHAGRTKLLAGLSVAAVGVVTLAVGVTFSVLAKQSSDSLTATARQGGVFDPAKANTGQTDSTVGLALLGVGAGATIAGAVVAILGARDRAKARRSQVAVAPYFAPSGAGMYLSWRF